MSGERQEASEMSLSNETIKGFIGKLLIGLTGFVGTIIFANLLGQARLGAFYLLFAAAQLFERPMGGFAEAVKKRASESEAPESQIMGSHGFVNLIWIGVVVAGSLIFAGPFNAYIGVEGAWWLFALLLCSEALYSTFVPILQARGRIGLAIGMDALRSYVTFPVQLILVWLGFGVGGMVAGLVVASLVAVPVAFRYHRIWPSIPSTETARNVIRYARYSVPSAVVSKAYQRFDTLLLGLLIINAQPVVANYGVAARVTLPAVFLASTAAGGLFVKVSNLDSKEGATGQTVTDTLSFSSILAVPLFFGGAVIAGPMVEILFSGDYPGAAPFVIGLAFYRLVQSQTTVLERAVGGVDRPRQVFRVSLIGLAINIVLGIGLILLFGPLGVVFATIAAESTKYGLFAWVVRQEFPGIGLFPRPLLHQLVSGLVMCVVVYAASSTALQIQSWIGLGITLLLGAIVYGAVLYAISGGTREMVSIVLADLNLDR